MSPMSTTDTLMGLWAAFSKQIVLPAEYAWAPSAGLAVLTLLGLIMLARGAQWAPGLAGMLFGVLFGGVGTALAGKVGLPPVPTGLVAGVVGLGAGFMLFKLLQALIMSACLAVLAVGVYYARVLTPEVHNWLSRGVQGAELTLPAAGTVVGDGPHWSVELNSLWTHLTGAVPQFQMTLFGLIAVLGLAGFVLGWLLPALSRALWAATLGTTLVGIGVFGLLGQYAGSTFESLRANPNAVLGALGGLWLLAFGWNLFCTRRRKPRAAAEDDAGVPSPA